MVVLCLEGPGTCCSYSHGTCYTRFCPQFGLLVQLVLAADCCAQFLSSFFFNSASADGAATLSDFYESPPAALNIVCGVLLVNLFSATTKNSPACWSLNFRQP